MSSAEPRPYLASLAGIRFFAALHVAIYHLAQFSYAFSLNAAPEHSRQSQWAGEVWGIFDQSWISRGLVKGALVELSMFFIMSGFILTYVHPVGRDGAFDRGNYFRHRASRLLPMYFFGLLVTLPIFLAFWLRPDSPLTPSLALMAVFLVPLLLHAWSPTLALTPWNPPAWSLSVEAFAYGLFPRAAMTSSRWGAGRLIAFALICWITMLVAPIVYLVVNPDGLPRDAQGLAAVTWISEGYWLNFVRYNPLLRLPEFLLGMALGQLFSQRAVRNYQTGCREGGWTMFACVLAILGVLSFTEYIPYLVLHNGLLAPLFGIGIVSLALGGGWIGKVCAWRPVVLLGESAFALYMLHFAVLAYTMFGISVDLRQKDKPPPDPIVYVVFFVFFSIGLSVVVHLWIERPLRRVVSRLLQPKRREQRGTVAAPTAAVESLVDERLAPVTLAQTASLETSMPVVAEALATPPADLAAASHSFRRGSDGL